MLLKWLLTALAMIWLYQAIQQLLLPNGGRQQYHTPPPPRRPVSPEPPPRPEGEVSVERKNKEINDGEYIDYEEIK
jgi:hypothetical protein